MAFKAVVKHGGGLAHYVLTAENEGIYQAHLMRFDGRPDRAPARSITLMKGPGDQWWSNNDIPRELLNELGRIVETKLRQARVPHNQGMDGTVQQSRRS